MGFMVDKEYMFKDEQRFNAMMDKVGVNASIKQLYKELGLNPFRVTMTDTHGNALSIMQGNNMIGAHKFNRPCVFFASERQFFVECPAQVDKTESEPETIDEMLKEFEKLDTQIKELAEKRDKLKAKLTDKLNDAALLLNGNAATYRGCIL